jgi:hypothetical protein
MTVALWHGGQEVAYHRRCYRRRQQILELEHYLGDFRKIISLICCGRLYSFTLPTEPDDHAI